MLRTFQSENSDEVKADVAQNVSLNWNKPLISSFTIKPQTSARSRYFRVFLEYLSQSTMTFI